MGSASGLWGCDAVPDGGWAVPGGVPALAPTRPPFPRAIAEQLARLFTSQTHHGARRGALSGRWERAAGLGEALECGPPAQSVMRSSLHVRLCAHNRSQRCGGWWNRADPGAEAAFYPGRRSGLLDGLWSNKQKVARGVCLLQLEPPGFSAVRRQVRPVRTKRPTRSVEVVQGCLVTGDADVESFKPTIFGPCGPTLCLARA